MSSEDDADQSYEVGRGRPPRHTQFSKGKSGNPNGRPKGSRNFATTIQRELKQRVTVTEEGRRKKITKREAAAKQLVNKAASGDPRLLQLLLNETRNQELETTVSVGGGTPLPEEDDRVLKNILTRIRETNNAAAEDPSSTAAPPSSETPASETESPESKNSNEGK